MQLQNNQTVTLCNMGSYELDGLACRVIGMVTTDQSIWTTYIVERCDEKLFSHGYKAIAVQQVNLK